MTSNLLSRFRPTSDPVAASIYETIREHDQEGSDHDPDEVDMLEAGGGPRVGLLSPRVHLAAKHSDTRRQRRDRRDPRFGSKSRQNARLNGDEIEDDVPASLLIEDNDEGSNPRPPHSGLREPIPSTWQLPPPPHALSNQEALPLHHGPTSAIGTSTMATASPREKAMWRWANVENLDNFLGDVYDYYIFRGFWSTMLRRFLNLITVVFVIGFSFFLTQCIDYRRIKGSSSLDDILIKRCTARMGFLPNAVLWLASFMCIIRCFQYVMDTRRLRNLHNFYLHLLNIPESEIQSISWQEVVSRLMALRDSNPNIRTAKHSSSKRFMGTQSKQRMDAHDIANRLMRKENYMVAMVNKDVLDTTLTLPLLGKRQFFTRTLEWHLNYCVMDYVFNQQGQIKQLFLKDSHRRALSDGLKRRFIFAGATSLILAPVLIVYFLVQNFFQHFNEYQKDPAQIGSRQYNAYAQWKFREFNELWHLFDRRMKMSYPFATRYINQFPKDKTVQSARFVSFVSGAIVSVLGLATILDQENFLGFEITSGRTTIFYLGIFGSIWAIARGMLPDENMIYDSSYSMEEVIEFTHYKPPHWDGRLHTVEVKTEFEQLYQMKIVVILEEILSMIFTPFVLWFSLPGCSDRIIDFFREFTVNVDGLGYVCSFAEFNFKKPAQTGTGANAGTRATTPAEIAAQARENEYYAAKDDKLERSYYNFINDYSQNPKTDIRFAYNNRYRRRQFHAPPPFPGPLSPELPHDHVTTTGADTSIARRQRREADHRSTARRLESTSPHQSVLLDPHHQPGTTRSLVTSPPTLRSRFSGAKSRLLPVNGDTIISTAVKEEEEDEDLIQQDQTTSATNGGQSGGDLGSWKYEDDLDGDSSVDEDADAIVQGGGVLGLIKQFQKAHDDDKRAGAGV